MRVQVLYSGGKDSSLAAVLLEPFFDVELVTCTFGSDAWRQAEKAANALGLPFRTMTLGPDVMDECIDLILRHGYPRHGISLVHRRALEALAAGSEYIADGTRRDDHSPMLTMSEVRSLEMRFGVSYLRPLAGYGRRAIDALVRRRFEIVEGPDIEKADYEAEIKSSIKERYGEETVMRLFPPEHAQSRVMRRL
jgi:predicted subunit of tRNA(5-methylaminomethyl-2-thiouridylate) methyltransferase